MTDSLYGRGLYVFTGLSTDAKSPTSDVDASTWSKKPLPGQRAFEFDKGEYQFNGDEWRQITFLSSNGSNAGLMVVADNIPGAVQNDDYSTPTLSTTEGETLIAIPTNSNGDAAVGVEIGNEDATAANMIKALFGDVTVIATATAGHLIHAASVRSIPIHKDATHVSLISLAGTPKANIIWHMPE